MFYYNQLNLYYNGFADFSVNCCKIITILYNLIISLCNREVNFLIEKNYHKKTAAGIPVAVGLYV